MMLVRLVHLMTKPLYVLSAGNNSELDSIFSDGCATDNNTRKESCSYIIMMIYLFIILPAKKLSSMMITRIYSSIDLVVPDEVKSCLTVVQKYFLFQFLNV